MIFKDPQKDLFDANGADLEDIKQGAVGDCYFLSALANLANEKDEHLLQEMIEEVGDKYIVTLHQNGIPVQIEVDKKLMYRQLQEGTELVGGGNDSDYIAAKPIGDSWVAIIEKAYAKMVSDGDYTQGPMKAGRAEDAMKVLLGNKVREPKALYLTTAGELVLEPTADSKEFLNPLHMDKVTSTELQQIIQSADHKGYKMNVASPQSYQGGTTLTDSHLLNIGEDLYMTFKHGYTLYEAEEKTAWLFNPHGKTNKKRIVFALDVKQKIQKLEYIIEELRKVTSSAEWTSDFRDRMNNLLDDLENLDKGESYNITIGKIKSSWQAFEKKEFKVRRIASFLKKIDKELNVDLRQGFVRGIIEIKGKQKIPYQSLKKYFDYVVFTIIE